MVGFGGVILILCRSMVAAGMQYSAEAIPLVIMARKDGTYLCIYLVYIFLLATSQLVARCRLAARLYDLQNTHIHRRSPMLWDTGICDSTK